MSNIQIIRNGQFIPLKIFDFPAGEIGVKIENEAIGYVGGVQPPYQTIIARIQSSKDIIALVLITDALRRLDNTPIRLFMPYTPYARQDRVCVTGESHSLKAFATIINNLSFERVIVIDPHSDVVAAVFDRLYIISQLDIINRFDAFHEIMRGGATFISPDAGANKKTSVLAAYFGHKEFLRADKLRNLENGKIKETIVYADDLTGQTIVIADDLVDGGASFIGLAATLKKKNAAKVVLYATHGIFSKGFEVLYNGGIDDIYTTDSYRTDLWVDSRAKVLGVDRFMGG